MGNNWKEIAKQKQLTFKKELGLSQSGMHAGKEYTHILSNNDAEKGANFYCYNDKQELEQLEKWAKSQNRKVNFLSNGLKNMLRSEHIPYNLFYPLEKLRKKENGDLEKFLNSLFDFKMNITKVLSIEIESATNLHKNDLLKDNTSFDTYIEYLDENLKCGIGIEIKYTERSYPYGKTEIARMDNVKDEYNELTNRCGLFKTAAASELRKKELKQPWRNHLLGIKLKEIGYLKKFHSVHLYPEGNLYQKEVCNEYENLINSDYKDSFIPLTFERFILELEPYDIKITKYLKDRY